ncbi:MAG: anti-sigma factor [Burkholderiaceae bacterium]|nr:anti-sigma factor [Burkholderiaceae bacterium]
MSESDKTPGAAELDAWVDDRLGPEEFARVQSALDADPQMRARAAADRAISEALRAQLDLELSRPVPQSLERAARGERGAVAANAGRFAQVASLLFAVALGAVIGWVAHSATEQSDRAAAGNRSITIPLPRAASVAHAAFAPEVRHPVEVGAGEQAHLVAWLSKRLGTPLKVPDLEAQGYRLVGGRLLPDAGRGVAAQFMFESAQGRRLTLFVRGDEAGSDTAFRYASANGLSTFYWLDRGYGYALSGELPREAMLAVATEVYRQINP